MPRPKARALIPALGVCAALGAYVWLNGVLVWPWLSRTRGDFGFQYPAAAALLAGASPFGAPWYDYPPLAPVLLAPLALLPFEQARVVWFLLGHACLLGAAALLVRPLAGQVGSGKAVLAVAGVWLLGGTIQENLALGQWNPVLLLLLALAWRLDARPGRSAAVLGLAAGIKIWPGLLLAVNLLRRRWRALAQGLAAAAAALLLPGLLIAALVPPPHLPVHGPYWMGSPAPLNLSLPAAVLRATYPDHDRGPAGIPHDWDVGNNPEQLRLTPSRRALSVAVSLAVLAAGLSVLAWRIHWRRPAAGPTEGGRAERGPRGGRRGADGSRPIEPRTSALPHPEPDAEPPRTGTRSAGLPRLPERGPRPAGVGGPRLLTDGPPLLAALIALALLAAPLAWYHYQLLQLPGIAWLAAGRLGDLAAVDPRKKAPGRESAQKVLALLGLAALLTGLTRTHPWYPLARWLGAGEHVALQAAGWAVSVLGIVLFALLAREVGGSRPGAPPSWPPPCPNLPPPRGEGRGAREGDAAQAAQRLQGEPA